MLTVKPKFSAVAFDLDGTLYPDSRLFLRLVPFVLKNLRLMKAMGKVRSRLRKACISEGSAALADCPCAGDFYLHQARLMAEILGEDAETVREKTERLIYRGWEPLFKHITPFSDVRETLATFRRAGIRLGLLSDFPPHAKLENINLAEYWDAILCSEQTGRLKPDPASFLELARQLETEPQNILYVGNKPEYDVKGAVAAGMHAALILPWWKKRPAMNVPFFAFSDYRQLCDYVLH